MKHYSDQLQSHTSQLLRARAVSLSWTVPVDSYCIHTHSATPETGALLAPSVLFIQLNMTLNLFFLSSRGLQIDSMGFTRSMGTMEESSGVTTNQWWYLFRTKQGPELLMNVFPLCSKPNGFTGNRSLKYLTYDKHLNKNCPHKLGFLHVTTINSFRACALMSLLQWVECHRERDGRWTTKCWSSYGCVSVDLLSSHLSLPLHRFLILICSKSL